MSYKVAIVSDSHGNINFIETFIKKIKPLSINQVIHLGDFYQDCQPILDEKFHLTRIPGTWTPYYLSRKIDNRVFETIYGWNFFLTHTPTQHMNDLPEDINPKSVIQEKKCDIFCHGHTHRPRAEKENGVLILNPGHIKESEDRGFLATFAILDLEADSCEVTIHHLLDDTIYLQKRFSK